MDDVTDGGTAVERTNLALGHDVTDEDTGTVVPDVTDGNTDTGWTQTGKTDATLVVDLDGTYSITGAGITLQQIAADFPLRYEIDVWNGSGWVEIGRSEADAVSSKNEVAADILGSKVRWKLHSTNGRDLTRHLRAVRLGSRAAAARVHESGAWRRRKRRPQRAARVERQRRRRRYAVGRQRVRPELVSDRPGVGAACGPRAARVRDGRPPVPVQGRRGAR